MTPELSLVTDLKAYDPELRIRWGRHTEKWLIERHIQCNDERLSHCLPPPDDASKIRKDLYEGWREGYVHVLTVPIEMAYWHFIGPELARADSWRQGGFAGMNDKLDEEAAEWEKQADRKVDNFVEAATDDAYERLAWLQGRRMAVSKPEPVYEDSGMGFKVRDRRHG